MLSDDDLRCPARGYHARLKQLQKLSVEQFPRCAADAGVTSGSPLVGHAPLDLVNGAAKEQVTNLLGLLDAVVSDCIDWRPSNNEEVREISAEALRDHLGTTLSALFTVAIRWAARRPDLVLNPSELSALRWLMTDGTSAGPIDFSKMGIDPNGTGRPHHG